MNELTLRPDDLIENPTARVPVILCLDISYSMKGDPIRELADGVKRFYEAVFDDEIARYAAEIGVVTFGHGGVQRAADFGPVEREPRLEIQAGGRTPMGEAVCEALDMLKDRKRQYQKTGVDYHQPWLVLMTDSRPNDDTREAIWRISDMVRERKLTVFPIGIGSDARMDILRQFSPNRDPLRLRGLEFRKFFEWLSKSIVRVSASTPGQKVLLDEEGATGAKGWGTL